MSNSVIFALFLLWTPFLILAQTGSESNSSSNTCDCSPTCTSLDSNFDCKHGRIMPREDCPCCKICLRQEGESCGDVNAPCDSKRGLTCSSKGVCEAKCKIDSDCPTDRFCVKDMCADPCPLLQPCLGSLKGGRCVTRGHQPRCECPKGTVPNTETNSCVALEGDFKPSSIVGKDQKPTMKQQEKFSGKPGMLYERSSTHNSTTLVLPSSSGGVLHYKESRSDVEPMKLTVAEGESEVEVTGLSPSTRYTFKWAGSGTGVEVSKGKIEVRTKDGCRHSSMSYPVGAMWHDGCQTTCSCHRGGVSECRPRCIFVAGTIQDDQCEERPSTSDPECCVEYNCEKKDNSVLDSPPLQAPPSGNQQDEPKLIVTSRSHNSITVAWDDFSADNPDRGYVTEYREVPSVQIATEIPWMKKETLRGQPPPTMTIGNLKPNTLYEVRVGIYSQAEERRLSAATETMTVRTEPGCVYGNTSFPVGEFFQGCEERCSCAKDGSVKCAGRCTIPYFRKGSFSNDPLCAEEQEDGDECCVLVMCARGGGIEEGDYDQCANTVCGKNAECVSLLHLAEASSTTQEQPPPGSCRCKDGFSGDPNDHVKGCIADPTSVDDSNNCMFRLTSYSPGDMFYDGCSYKCTCNHQREIECQPRCQYAVDVMHEVTNNSCSYQPDPEDDCCKIRVCNSTSDAAMDEVQTPALDFDGCIYRNKTYAKNEEFTFGCDSKCLCMGFSDVSCFPRCPPVKEMSEREGVRCETLLDPEDECCDVTVCDDIAPDVMKENITESPEDMMENVTAISQEDGDMIMADDMTKEDEMKSTNETMMDSDDLSATTKPSVDMSMSESEMKNMTSVEQVDESDGVMMNETMPGDMMKNDVMNEHENGTEEEDATMLETDDDFEMTNMDQNATEPEIIAGLMGRGLQKELFPGNQEGEMNATTISPEAIEEDIMLDRTGRINVTEPLMKKPRLDDIVFPQLEIGDIVPVDSSTVKMTVKVSHEILTSLLSSPTEHMIASYSHDSLTWTNTTIPVNKIEVENMYDVIFSIPNLEAHDAYQFKVYYRDLVSPTTKASLTAAHDAQDIDVIQQGAMCEYNGKKYESGESFYDNCEAYCQCNEDLQVHCEKMECPERFGLDIVDPGCLEWADDPEYVASPPRCCGQIPKCALHIDQLACTHMGQTFSHLDFIPKELVGCDQRCQCLSGYLDCESLCGPVAASPPFHLQCEDQDARIITAASFPCCKEWQCVNDTDIYPGHHPDLLDHPGVHFPGPAPPEPGLNLMEVTDITQHSAQIAFSIADIFVGLPGGIYLRYTSNAMMDSNPLNWESEVIHEDGTIMDRAHWQYMKKGLEPGTNYTMQLALFTHLKRAETVSELFTVTTHVEVTTPLPRLELDAELSANEIKNTTAIISWKHFNDYELQYIDGIRVRFWPGNKKFPVEGPMLHREAVSMILRDLIPDTRYTVDLFFIPHEGLTTTILNTKNTTFTTLPKPKDKYAFSIVIEAGEMTKDGVKILFSGVPEPEGKFVNVYRVVYTTDGDYQDSQKFKVPKTQKDGYIMLTDMKAGVQYEVWLEAYLTSGGKKKSNVITINTKPGELPTPEKSEIGESKQGNLRTSYYSAFVVVVILVVLACLIILALVFILFRRQNHAKAHINSSKGNSAYDNPSYKASENQQAYAMELNGLKNTTNGGSRPEEP